MEREQRLRTTFFGIARREKAKAAGQRMERPAPRGEEPWRRMRDRWRGRSSAEDRIAAAEEIERKEGTLTGNCLVGTSSRVQTQRRGLGGSLRRGVEWGLQMLTNSFPSRRKEL